MRKDDRASCIHLTYSSCLIEVPHLPLAKPNSLSRRTVTKTSTDGHTSPLQIITHLLIRLERFEILFYGRMISFLLASLIRIFLGVLLTCYALLEPPRPCILLQLRSETVAAPSVYGWFMVWMIYSMVTIWHGRLARWIKWRACNVGEAKEGLENELWRSWSNGRVGEGAVT